MSRPTPGVPRRDIAEEGQRLLAADAARRAEALDARIDAVHGPGAAAALDAAYADGSVFAESPHTQGSDELRDPSQAEPRSYVIGLPVVLTVHDDGRVTAEVDLSEASDLGDASTPEDQPEDAADADTERITRAVDAGTVEIVKPQPWLAPFVVLPAVPDLDADPQGNPYAVHWATCEVAKAGRGERLHADHDDAYTLPSCCRPDPEMVERAMDALLQAGYAEKEAALAADSAPVRAELDAALDNAHSHDDGTKHSHVRGDMAHEHVVAPPPAPPLAAVVADGGMVVVVVLSLAGSDCSRSGDELSSGDVDEGVRARFDEFYPWDDGYPVSPVIHSVTVL